MATASRVAGATLSQTFVAAPATAVVTRYAAPLAGDRAVSPTSLVPAVSGLKATTVATRAPAPPPAAVLAPGVLSQPSTTAQKSILGTIVHAVTDIGAVALAPVTGGASLAATHDTRAVIGAAAGKTGRGIIADIIALATAPVTGGASLGLAKGTREGVVKGAKAVATPEGVGILGGVIGVAAAPFTGGISLALPAITTPLAAAWKNKQNQKKVDEAAAKVAAAGYNPNDPYGLGSTPTSTWLLYGALAVAAVFVIAEFE